MSDTTAATAPPLLHAATARSGVARGRIAEVRLPPLPEGIVVIDASRIPGRNLLVHLGLSMPFLAENAVSYLGEPVVLLGGPDREQLASLSREVVIACEPPAGDEPESPV